MWEQAEVTVVSRVISVAPPDLQELTPIHSSDCLPCQRGRGHTQRHTQKKNVYTPTSTANGRSVGVGHVPLGETYCGVWVANVFCHLGLFVFFSLYMSVFIWELAAGVWAEGRWKHTWWFWVTSCLRHTVSLSLSLFPWLAVQHIIAVGSRLRWMSAASTQFMLMIYGSLQMWMRTFTIAKGIDNAETERTPTCQQNDFLQPPFPSFVLWESLSVFVCLPLMHPHTHTRAHKHTRINSPLGVCCFHYLQLGPETAFRVEYSRAELARIAVYTERSLVIASSLFSLSCASGGKYESVVSGDPPCCAAPHHATTVCPPTGHK